MYGSENMGETVFDTQIIKIDVTDADIAKGVPGWSDSCAFALALRRVFPEARFFNNFWYPSLEWHSRDWRDLPTNKAIARFGDNFDAEKPVTPHRFHLRVRKDIVEEFANLP